MKRLIISLMLFFLPLNVLAYSSNVLLGGNTIGIDVDTKGILIIGFYKINNKFNKADLKAGDYILKVNNENVSNIKDLTNIITSNVSDGSVLITYLRNGHEKQTKLDLIYDNNIYKTGLYVKDGITGIGTLTYIDPESKIYGALGHEIIESNINKIVEIKSGTIFKNSITSIDKSVNGTPGSKNAKFYYKTVYGTIEKNTPYGIYGHYNNKLPENSIIEVATPAEVKIGLAKIYTVLNGESIEEFSINITSINSSNSVKNISYEIIDDTLINKTGGIVQGMSGSPIVQNAKLIGAVTHVIVDNPVTGYGIFITTMLNEGEK